MYIGINSILFLLWMGFYISTGELLLLACLIPVALWTLKISYRAFRGSDEDPSVFKNSSSTVILNESDQLPLVYHGSQLNFSDKLITDILEKRFSYYQNLNVVEKEKFLLRLKFFINDKTFTIHDKAGLKEMPILISASAIQLTFGLQNYMLKFFRHINVYPAEFIGLTPTVRYLIGNVSGNKINIGWRYFIEGIQNPNDGKNLGLHEMSHALYYQTFVVEGNEDRDFLKTFNQFTTVGDKVYCGDADNQEVIYSTYALKNFQEFWAESIELFFEKPHQMYVTHPDLYSSLSDLLEQDPLLW